MRWRGNISAAALSSAAAFGIPYTALLARSWARSAVYGMPKAAAELNAAAEILPLHRIAPALLQRFHFKLNP